MCAALSQADRPRPAAGEAVNSVASAAFDACASVNRALTQPSGHSYIMHKLQTDIAPQEWIQVYTTDFMLQLHGHVAGCHIFDLACLTQQQQGIWTGTVPGEVGSACQRRCYAA